MNIDHKLSIEKLAHYWSSFPIKMRNTKNIFVGDIHGDLNQFLLPLVENDIIRIKDSIHLAYKGKVSDVSNVYVPDWEIGKSSQNIQVYYVGDYCDEGIHTRTILCLMSELIRKLSNLHFCIGNHESNLVGNYMKWKDNKLQPCDIRSYWGTMQKEVSYTSKVHVYRNVIDSKLLHDYTAPIFEILHDLLHNKHLNICYDVKLNDKHVCVSHTIITNLSIKELAENKPRGEKSKSKQTDDIHVPTTCNEVNELYLCSSDTYKRTNRITYNRSETDFWRKTNIIGHTPGGYYREKPSVNPIPCKFNSERILHCKPTDVKGNEIYYFDICASSGFDIDNVSTPDYFYFDEDEHVMKVSNAKAIRLFYDVCTNKLTLQEYGGKTKFEGVNEIK